MYLITLCTFFMGFCIHNKLTIYIIQLLYQSINNVIIQFNCYINHYCHQINIILLFNQPFSNINLTATIWYISSKILNKLFVYSQFVKNLFSNKLRKSIQTKAFSICLHLTYPLMGFCKVKINFKEVFVNPKINIILLYLNQTIKGGLQFSI